MFVSWHGGRLSQPVHNRVLLYDSDTMASCMERPWLFVNLECPILAPSRPPFKLLVVEKAHRFYHVLLPDLQRIECALRAPQPTQSSTPNPFCISNRDRSNPISNALSLGGGASSFSISRPWQQLPSDNRLLQALDSQCFQVPCNFELLVLSPMYIHGVFQHHVHTLLVFKNHGIGYRTQFFCCCAFYLTGHALTNRRVH